MEINEFKLSECPNISTCFASHHQWGNEELRERGNKGREGRRRRKRKGKKGGLGKNNQGREKDNPGNNKIAVWAKAHHPLPHKSR